MIDNETVENLVRTLDQAVEHFKAGTVPDKKWLDDAGWLVYHMNLDILNGGLDIDFNSKAILDEKDKRISELENEVSDLDDECGKLQDRNDKLVCEIFKLDPDTDLLK